MHHTKVWCLENGNAQMSNDVERWNGRAHLGPKSSQNTVRAHNRPPLGTSETSDRMRLQSKASLFDVSAAM